MNKGPGTDQTTSSWPPIGVPSGLFWYRTTCSGQRHTNRHSRLLIPCRSSDPVQRKKYVEMTDGIREKGGEVLIFSSMHETGQRKLLTGWWLMLTYSSCRTESIDGYRCDTHIPSRYRFGRGGGTRGSRRSRKGRNWAEWLMYKFLLDNSIYYHLYLRPRWEMWHIRLF